MRHAVLWMIARVASAATYEYGAGADRVLAIEPQGVIHRVSPELEIHDGLAVHYVKSGGRRVVRQVVESFATRLFPDLSGDGKITAGDVWLGRGGEAPMERMLLSSARRVLYEGEPQTTWLGSDHLGSITIETNAQAGVVGRRGYSPFGATVGSKGQMDRHGFTNQEADAHGALAFQYRQLDPALGRWRSPDPLFAPIGAGALGSLGESTTAYAYAGNKACNFVDPTGLKGEKIMLRAAFNSRYDATSASVVKDLLKDKNAFQPYDRKLHTTWRNFRIATTKFLPHRVPARGAQEGRKVWKGPNREARRLRVPSELHSVRDVAEAFVEAWGRYQVLEQAYSEWPDAEYLPEIIANEREATHARVAELSDALTLAAAHVARVKERQDQ